MFLELDIGYRTALGDGTMVSPSPCHMATQQLYYAQRGDILRLEEEGYMFVVAVYTIERNDKWVYTYDYQPESNWASYTGNVTPEAYGIGEFVFREDCWFRANVKKTDAEPMTETDRDIKDRLLFLEGGRKEYVPNPCFLEEVDNIVQRVRQAAKPFVQSGEICEGNTWKEEIGRMPEDRIVLALLADSHYTVNGTWEDTAYTLKAVSERISLDALIHLGDLTDGLLPGKESARLVRLVMEDLQSMEVPVCITIGNHDTNYFHRNPERFTLQQQIDLYGISSFTSDTPYYYMDCKNSIRFIFLYSFDYRRPVRYGYDEEQLFWLEKTLAETPDGYKVLVFSHEAPLAELDYWSFYVWNGERLLELLEQYNALEHRQILAFFHGHIHGDYVYQECSFPIVSVGCAKCECVKEIKPPYIITPDRRLGERSQELWDTVVIHPNQETIQMIRFGAGGDRMLDCRKRISRWMERRMNKRQQNAQATQNSFPAIWAHRGVSGHAPENTLPAFELARRMELDGVELDVQLSRDGEVVVIHDETIDRTSDGTGMVVDYTLAELKQFQFAADFPEYGRVTIPTLREVLGIFQSTGMTVNIELKNSVIFYEGLEEKLLELVREYGMEEQVCYSSFNHYSLMKLKRHEPKARIGFLFGEQLLELPEYAKRFGADALHPGMPVIKLPNWVQESHEQGVRVHVWTVNTEEDILKAVEEGVDSIITNYPEKCLKLRYGRTADSTKRSFLKDNICTENADI